MMLFQGCASVFGDLGSGSHLLRPGMLVSVLKSRAERVDACLTTGMQHALDLHARPPHRVSACPRPEQHLQVVVMLRPGEGGLDRV